MVGQRPYGGALQGRGGQQRGGGALAADRPEAFGGAGDEDGAEQVPEGAAGGPVDPQGRDDEERDPHAVGADHGPAPVELPAGPGEDDQRSEEDGPEEDGGEQARADDGGHGERGPPVAAPERVLRHGRLEAEEDEDEEGEGVAGTAEQVGAPQPAQRLVAQEGAYGALP